jgi:hypothetical protein
MLELQMWNDRFIVCGIALWLKFHVKWFSKLFLLTNSEAQWKKFLPLLKLFSFCKCGSARVRARQRVCCRLYNSPEKFMYLNRIAWRWKWTHENSCVCVCVCVCVCEWRIVLWLNEIHTPAEIDWFWIAFWVLLCKFVLGIMAELQNRLHVKHLHLNYFC